MEGEDDDDKTNQESSGETRDQFNSVQIRLEHIITDHVRKSTEHGEKERGSKKSESVECKAERRPARVKEKIWGAWNR